MFKPTSVALDDSGTWPVLLPIGAHKHVPSFPIDGTTCLAGSRNHAQIVLNSPLVSKSHVLFVNDRGETYLRDLASTNGAYVNNTPVREARLSDGDILNIGRFCLICYNNFPSELEQEPDAALDAELLVERYHKRAPIRLRTCVIGRRPNCDMQLDFDETVAPVHAVIYRCGGRRFLHDLHSKEGTFLNHQRVRDAEVRPGDMIRIGQTIIRYERAPDSRGWWVPAIAAEQAAPVRLADQDEGPIDPMTDSSLERALLMHHEIKVAVRPSETMVGASIVEPRPPQSMLEIKGFMDLFAASDPPSPAVEPGSIELHPAPQPRAAKAPRKHAEPHALVEAVEETKQVVPDLSNAPRQPIVQNEQVVEHPDLIFEPELPPEYPHSLAHFAAALANAEETTTLNEVLAALQPALSHEGPTARNVDLPNSGSSLESEVDPYRRSMDMPAGDYDAPATAEEEPTPDAALLDECFHHETGL